MLGSPSVVPSNYVRETKYYLLVLVLFMCLPKELNHWSGELGGNEEVHEARAEEPLVYLLGADTRGMF